MPFHSCSEDLNNFLKKHKLNKKFDIISDDFIIKNADIISSDWNWFMLNYGIPINPFLEFKDQINNHFNFPLTENQIITFNYFLNKFKKLNQQNKLYQYNIENFFPGYNNISTLFSYCNKELFIFIKMFSSQKKSHSFYHLISFLENGNVQIKITEKSPFSNKDIYIGTDYIKTSCIEVFSKEGEMIKEKDISSIFEVVIGSSLQGLEERILSEN